MAVTPRVEIESIDNSAAPLSGFDGLRAALGRLDAILGRAAEMATELYGNGTAAERFRGWYVSERQVEALVRRAPAQPLFAQDESPESPAHGTRCDELDRLCRIYNLKSFDVDVVLLALAPELDLKYERIYAYLHDDVSRRRPTVDLAMHLFCASDEERNAARERFAPDAPLMRHNVIALVPDPTAIAPPLLAQAIQLDEQIVTFLAGSATPDRRLAACAEQVLPRIRVEDAPLPADARRELRVATLRALEENEQLLWYFHGPHGAGKLGTAASLAGFRGEPLLVLDLERAADAGLDLERAMRLASRESWMRGTMLYVRAGERVDGHEGAVLRSRIGSALRDAPGVVVFSTTKPWSPEGTLFADAMPIAFGNLDASGRASVWRRALAEVELSADDETVRTLAARFRLTAGGIEGAVSTANARRTWHSNGVAFDAAAELFAAARAQSGAALSALARRVQTQRSWDELVLPADPLSQLHELAARGAQSARVLGEWGFGRRMSRGVGVTALFSGASGTGKTLAAEIIAAELGVDLYRVDLAGVVSKYIGETEKNLDRIFAAAENANGVLLFDEADALFGKRSEVRDSHDRYANIEISYLLQKMEQFDGVAILTTNLRGNLDDAFVRRLAFAVLFPFPDAASRRRIWEGAFPAQVPLAADVDLSMLSERFKLSGGNIANIVLAAAFRAAARDAPVDQADLLHATRREYQKLGKELTDAELAPSGSAVSA